MQETNYVSEECTSETSVKPSKPQWLVHLCLILGQTVNGGASVVAKCGLPATNPILFALLRESGASPVLLLTALLVDGKPRLGRSQVPLLFLSAVFLYGAQVGWITGIKFANPVVGSAWQPSQPIMVLLIAVLLRWETCTVGKTAGIFAALGGGLLMTFGAKASSEAGGSPVVGNGFFFVNCSSTALFIISMRVITRTLPSQTAVAVIYCITSVGILVTALLVSTSGSVQDFLCPDCTHSFWYFPLEAVPALFYWILGSSVFAYAMLGFGTKHAKDATHCLAYTALQPVVAGVGETLLVVTGWNSRNPQNLLSLPTWTQVIGAVCIVLGVFFVILDALRPGERARSSPPIRFSMQPSPNSD